MVLLGENTAELVLPLVMQHKHLIEIGYGFRPTFNLKKVFLFKKLLNCSKFLNLYAKFLHVDTERSRPANILRDILKCIFSA